jgi:aminopeptidase-like protein
MSFETSEVNLINIGKEMFEWASDLFPLNRSITGQGNRETLEYLKNILPDLNINNFKSGEQVFDWTIPDEWQIDEGYIEDEYGNKIIDFKSNNLHVLGYSESVDTWLTLDELNNFLYSLPDQPNAIPYITSYYNRRWGFCITHEQRLSLKNVKYHVVIKSILFKGQLDYGELIIQGKLKEEILLSTYICHPSMANNELSGIVVTAALARLLSTKKENRYSYRILFIPETIGSIAYLSRHWQYLKNHTLAGFVITCVGDNNNYSFLPSRNGDTYADKVAKYVLNNYVKNYKEYSFLERGSDERQFCSPLIDLPVVSVMRSKYATYREYHTSLDNLDYISKEGLLGSYNIYQKIILLLENNITCTPLIFCEPQLGKRGLYNTSSNDSPIDIVNLLAYIDGKNDLIDLSRLIKVDFFEIANLVNVLAKENLIYLANEH